MPAALPGRRAPSTPRARGNCHHTKRRTPDQRGWRPRVDEVGAQGTRGRRPRGADPTTVAGTRPSSTPGDSSTRAPVASAESRGLFIRGRRRTGPGQAPASAGHHVLARRPPGRHRPISEPVQPHPAPPRQPRRPPPAASSGKKDSVSLIRVDIISLPENAPRHLLNNLPRLCPSTA